MKKKIHSQEGKKKKKNPGRNHFLPKKQTPKPPAVSLQPGDFSISLQVKLLFLFTRDVLN